MFAAAYVDLITPDLMANMPENVNIRAEVVENKEHFYLLTLSDISTLLVRYPIIELYTSYSSHLLLHTMLNVTIANILGTCHPMQSYFSSSFQ